MFDKTKRFIIIIGVIILFISNNTILFGQNTETELFQGRWYEVPLSRLGAALMSNSYVSVEGFEFSNDNFYIFKIEGRGFLIMATPAILAEGRFRVNLGNQTIVLIDSFGDRTTLRYAFSDDNKTLRLRRDDGVTFTMYK